MSEASVDQKIEDAAVLLSAGGCHGEDTLHESATGFALGSKTTLPPQNRSPYGSLGCIVGRRNTLVVDERPQILGLLDDTFACSGHILVTTDLSLDQEIFNLDPKLDHPALESFPLQGPISNPMPPLEHEERLIDQLFSNSSRLAFKLGESDEFSEHVRPTKLSQPFVDVVGAKPITYQDAQKVSQKAPGCLLVSTTVDHENRQARCQHDPHPGLPVFLTPAGLVGVGQVGLPDCMLGFFDRFGQRFADVLLAVGHGAKAHLNPEDVFQHRLDETLALVTSSAEVGYERFEIGAELTGWHADWKIGPSAETTGHACAFPHAPFVDERLDFWQFPNLMAPWVREVNFQVRATTVSTYFWRNVLEIGDLVFWNQRTMVAFVSLLRASFALRLSLAFAFWLVSWRIAGRRFG